MCVDAIFANHGKHFTPLDCDRKLGYMSRTPIPIPNPHSPVRIFATRADIQDTRFRVTHPPVVTADRIGEITDEEFEALAHLLIDSYLRCKKQSPTFVSPTSAKPTTEAHS